ncbi:synaptogyrin-4 isoform X2 [Tupaia chinensis]|uniref:synaptogyrin-4 isoform X2 n=1 Tax=Tupaia chinensis TaxID=246437 RepID=UPI0003C90FA9|nr:synaptogyrin-4 isoform X2 [Tupaia chinensis]
MQPSPEVGLEPPESSAQQAAPSTPAPASQSPRSRAAAMHIPESLQELADSEAVQFLKRPKTVARIFTGVFSLIVFSSLLTDGYQNKTESPQLRCVLNSNSTACSFAVAASFLAFLTCLVFLALDAHEVRIAGTRFKTAFQLLDFILAILWVGISFVGFCFLANQWQHSPPKQFLLGNSSAKAAITFTFFSILAWVPLPLRSHSPASGFVKTRCLWVIAQAYLAFRDLQNDAPVPYKRSLDEGGVVLTTLSPPSATSPVNTPVTGPNSLSYSSSALSPYLATPKAPRLAMMPDS